MISASSHLICALKIKLWMNCANSYMLTVYLLTSYKIKHFWFCRKVDRSYKEVCQAAEEERNMASQLRELMERGQTKLRTQRRQTEEAVSQIEFHFELFLLLISIWNELLRIDQNFCLNPPAFQNLEKERALVLINFPIGCKWLLQVYNWQTTIG